MRQRPPIIALAGPDRVGKSTLADILRHEAALIGGMYHYAPGRVFVDGFGRPLREAAHLLCQHEPKSEGWRDWMREAGNGARMLRGDSVLIDLLGDRLDDEDSQGEWTSRLAIIDDLRTADEAKWVHANRGVVIELQRDGVTYSGHSLDSRLHPTLIDAVVPVGDKAETARHILRLTGWLA
jgi:hypothetical protein